MASYGEPAFLEDLPRAGLRRRRRRVPRRAGLDLARFAPPLRRARSSRPTHAALACSVQRRLEEVLLELAPLAARADGRPRPRARRRRRAQLRGELAVVARRAVRAACGCSRPSGDSGTALGRRAAGGARAGRRRRRRCAPRRSGAGGTTPRWPTRPARPRASSSRGRTTSPTPSPRCWPTTASWRGSRAARSSARARSATARCSPIRGGPRTSRSSTTSRAASSSARSRRWCWPSARARSSATGRSRRRTCSSPTASPRVARPDSGRGARRRHRPHPDRGPRRRAAGGAHARVASRRAPASRWSSTRP